MLMKLQVHERTYSYNYLKKIRSTFAVANYSNKVPFNNHRKVILGIETSCDDTGIAVVDTNGNILGESLYSQNVLHLRFGGVNPLIAYEQHRENIDVAVSEALSKANLQINNIDYIAVTTAPGLLVSLQVGVKYAMFLARQHEIPMIPIHHMEAHALVARMYADIPFPFLVLLVSGGHCLLSVVKDIDDFILLGHSLDNAPGEVLDKVARRMKLKNIPEYSKMAGGKAVEMAARKATALDLFKFPLPLIRYRDCNFSFSGLKDSLVRKLLKKESEHGIIGDGVIPEINELCASFQLAVAKHIAHRTERAMLFCDKNNLIPEQNKNIVVSGGVACNDFIFRVVKMMGSKMGYNAYRPPHRVCTDNGIMIAWNGIEKLKMQYDIHRDIKLADINPTAPLGKNCISDVTAANLQVKMTQVNKITDIYF